jgi:hypothetical protein
MANDFDPYEAADAPLREKESRLMAELDVVRKLRADIAAARKAAGTASPAVASVSVTSAGPLVSANFKGLGLEQAVAKVLSESDRIELTAKQIWTALAAAGFSLLSDRPEQSVSWALRKREKKAKDVILVGDGKWGMIDWYSQARIKELRASRNNASTRNSAEHIEKTKAGIANAKANRLSRWGRTPSVTADQMVKAYYARKNGADSKLAMARAGDIVYPTFLSYWQIYEMENWKPGDSFPPKRRAVRKANQEIKLKDMWPPDGEHTDLLNGDGIAVSTTTPH